MGRAGQRLHTKGRSPGQGRQENDMKEETKLLESEERITSYEFSPIALNAC